MRELFWRFRDTPLRACPERGSRAALVILLQGMPLCNSEGVGPAFKMRNLPACFLMIKRDPSPSPDCATVFVDEYQDQRLATTYCVLETAVQELFCEARFFHYSRGLFWMLSRRATIGT